MEATQAVGIVQEILRRDKDSRDTFCGVLCQKYRQALQSLIAQTEQASSAGETKSDVPQGVQESPIEGYPASSLTDGVVRQGAVTITYTSDSNRMTVPFIRLRGRWLEKLGWSTGTKVLVRARKESITLSKRTGKS